MILTRGLLKPVKTRPLISQISGSSRFKLDTTAFKSTKTRRLIKTAVLFPGSFVLAFNGSALFARRLDYFNIYTPDLDDVPAGDKEDPYYSSGAYKGICSGVQRSGNYRFPDNFSVAKIVQNQRDSKLKNNDKLGSKIRPCYQDTFWSVGINVPEIITKLLGINKETE